MKRALNIAIIGGGLMGLSSADSLIARGAKVTVFEKHSEVGHGAGRYNSGMIHPSQAQPWSDNAMDVKKVRALVGWANQSRDLLIKRRRELGCEDVSRPSGTLQIFDTTLARQDGRAFYDAINVRCREYKGHWDFGRYALEFPDDLSGNAHYYCQKLAEDLRQRGCDIRTHNLAEIVQQDGEHCVKVDNHTEHFDRIVIASGAASRDILGSIGYDLPVTPMRGHALVFDRPKCALPEMPIMHAASHSALTVFHDHLRLSGTINKDEPAVLLDIWENIATDIVKSLSAPITKWSADRPHSEIGHPIIGPTPLANISVNCGHGHMGWSLCTWSGETLAEQLFRGAKKQIAI